MFLVDLDNVNNSLCCIYVDDNIYKAFPKEITEFNIIITGIF